MGAFAKFADGVADLTTLTVQTFSGTLSSTVVTTTDGDGKDKQGVLDWTKLMSEAKSSGTVKLMASTAIQLDGDTNTFYATSIDATTRAAHDAAFTAAQQYRQGVINMFKDALNFVD